jgi:hypothetical protein
MDFAQAARLASAWVDILCEGQARIAQEATIAKPYGWIFFYQSSEFLDVVGAVSWKCTNYRRQKYVRVASEWHRKTAEGIFSGA